MTDDHQQVRDLIDFAKSSGVKRLVWSTWEVEFFPPAAQLQELDPKALRDPLFSPVSEDEVRLWHVGGSGAQDTNGNEIVPPLVGEDDAD